MPTLHSIQIGKPQDYPAVPGQVGAEKPWTTAIFKEPILDSIQVDKLGLVGDGQANKKHHGGVDKAICVYSLGHYDYWQEQLNKPDFLPGAFGENLTVAGMNEADVCLGDVWQVGSAKLQVSQPRQPCATLARRWAVKDLALQVQQNGYTGWYLRVIEEGVIEPSDEIKLIERPSPDWPLTRANEVMHHKKKDREAAEELAAVELLSESWIDQLQKRIVKLG